MARLQKRQGYNWLLAEVASLQKGRHHLFVFRTHLNGSLRLIMTSFVVARVS